MILEFVSRLLAALTIVAIGLALYSLANRWLLQRAQARLRFRRSGLEQVESGRPVLLYFTTPTCAPCETVQRPAIQRLQTLMGDQLQVIEIDATSRPEVAHQWGVLSVPTTFVIDANGQPRHINHGVARFEKLSRQMANL